jgi:tetratricopeptide (TPR) repeat protein
MRFTLVLSGMLYLSALAAAAMQPAPAQSGRFDMAVRADFFAAFSGDMKRFERAMARCEEVLAADPNHAEAMVWHGSGVFFRAGLAFQKGDIQNGMALYQKGLAEMQRAVEIAPDNVGVRIPRGAVLLEATRQMPEPQAKALVQIGVSDFEHTLKLQESYFATLSDHAKGELLFGLADGWARLGDQQKAMQYFTRLTKDAAASGRATYAKAWLDGTPPANPGRCVGCH